MPTPTFIIISLLFLIFGVFSKRLQNSMFTSPAVFTAAGLLLGPFGLNVLDIHLTTKATRIIAELTLILVLFSDAARLPLKILKKDHDIPLRLLTIGLSLMILIGALVAYWVFPSFSFFDALLLSAILAPTDAALIHSVVSYSKVPLRIRQALNIESGLNDGLVVPVIMLVFSFYSVIDRIEPVKYWLFFVVKQLGLAVFVGTLVGYLGGRLCLLGHKKQWMGHTFEQLSAIALALLSYFLAELTGGNGFIAAFIGGLVIGATTKKVCKCIQDFASTEGQFLALLLFLFFGASFAPQAIVSFRFDIFMYAILSLTLIRFIASSLSLLNLGLCIESFFYLSWFGPRGIASIVFGLLVLENTEIAMRQEIFLIATTTIFLSIFLHGFTAMPAAAWYSRKIRREKRRPEHKVVKEFPTRIPFLK